MPVSVPTLYFFLNPVSRLIKIGVSFDPDGRRRSLETSVGSRLRVLGVVKEAGDLELALHAAFDSDRQVGEWFKVSPELLRLACDPSREKVLDLISKRYVVKPWETDTRGVTALYSSPDAPSTRHEVLVRMAVGRLQRILGRDPLSVGMREAGRDLGKEQRALFRELEKDREMVRLLPAPDKPKLKIDLRYMDQYISGKKPVPDLFD